METGDSCCLEFHVCADSFKLERNHGNLLLFRTRFIPRIHHAAVLMHYDT
jgi:hypothetical protein